MKGNPYSALKIFHHQDRLDQLRAGEQIVPTQVQLILSDLCNQDCSFCSYRMSGYTQEELFTKGTALASFGTNNPNRHIPTKKVLEILDDCLDMGVNAIQFTGGGEPTVHPEFRKCYSYAQDLRLKTSLVTNGVLLGRYIDIAAKSAWVRISIDAGSARTYAKVRRVKESAYDTAWNNIKELAEADRADDNIIGVGYVVTKDNYNEIVSCVQKAKDAGADNIRISAVFQPDDENYFSEIYDRVVNDCKYAIHEFQDDKFKVFNLFGDRVEDLAQHAPDYDFCGYQQFNTYIGGDQNVYRCCVQSYSQYGKIGSLEDQTFKELWESERKKTDFQTFDATNCERCMFNNKNRTILYALERDPLHVDFV